MYEDKKLTCVDCGAEFTFTASEQEFYAEKGFTNEPKRCHECRQARKRQRSQKQMFTVTCDECGVDTQVPFQPTEGRPVYCSDCFKARRRY